MCCCCHQHLPWWRSPVRRGEVRLSTSPMHVVSHQWIKAVCCSQNSPTSQWTTLGSSSTKCPRHVRLRASHTCMACVHRSKGFWVRLPAPLSCCSVMPTTHRGLCVPQVDTCWAGYAGTCKAAVSDDSCHSRSSPNTCRSGWLDQQILLSLCSSSMLPQAWVHAKSGISRAGSLALQPHKAIEYALTKSSSTHKRMQQRALVHTTPSCE